MLTISASVWEYVCHDITVTVSPTWSVCRLRFTHRAGDIVSAAAGNEYRRELLLARLIRAADRFHYAVDLAVDHAVVDLKFERFVFEPRLF